VSTACIAERTTVLKSQAIRREHKAVLPLRGLPVIGWYAKFFVDPVGCMIEAQRWLRRPCAGRSFLFAPTGAGNANIFLAFGPDHNRDVLGNPAVFS